MTKVRGSVLIAIVAAFALVLSACSKDSPTPASSVAVPGGDTGDVSGTSAEAYATSVCGAMTTWLTDIQAIAADAPTTYKNVKQAKKQITSLLDSMIESTETMATSVADTPAPDVDGGTEAAAAMTQTMQNVADLFIDARDQVQDAPNDPTAFNSTLTVLQSSMSAAGTQATAGLSGISSPNLSEAFTTAPACTQMSSTVAAASAAA